MWRPCGPWRPACGWGSREGAGSREQGAGVDHSAPRSRFPPPLSKQSEERGYGFVDQRLSSADDIGRKVPPLCSQLEKDLGFCCRAERNSQVSLELRRRTEGVPLNDIGFHGYRGAA